jgi:LysR family transcriptional regulator, regulator for metE and metH
MNGLASSQYVDEPLSCNIGITADLPPSVKARWIRSGRHSSMALNHNVKLEVRHLKLLAAVAEEGSVTEAGHKLHLTQSALSHQLRDAEERLGTALFLRLGKKMVLTPAGEKLLESARKILDEMRLAETQIEGINGGTRGVVRVSTECYTCYHWLPPVLKKFQMKFPRVDVDIVLEATARPIQALLEGQLDVAVVSCPPRNKSIKLTPTCEDEMLVVVGPKHRLASSSHVEPRDMAGETVLCYPPKEESTLLRKVLGPANVIPERIIAVPLTESIVDLASAGLGVALLAKWAIGSYLQSGKVIARPLRKGGFRRHWYAATLRKRPDSPYLTEFVNLLARTCALDSARS